MSSAAMRVPSLDKASARLALLASTGCLGRSHSVDLLFQLLALVLVQHQQPVKIVHHESLSPLHSGTVNCPTFTSV